MHRALLALVLLGGCGDDAGTTADAAAAAVDAATIDVMAPNLDADTTDAVPACNTLWPFGPDD